MLSEKERTQKESRFHTFRLGHRDQAVRRNNPHLYILLEKDLTQKELGPPFPSRPITAPISL